MSSSMVYGDFDADIVSENKIVNQSAYMEL